MTEEKKNFVVEVKNNYHNDLNFADYNVVIKKGLTHKFLFQKEEKRKEFIERINKIKYFSIVKQEQPKEEAKEENVKEKQQEPQQEQPKEEAKEENVKEKQQEPQQEQPKEEAKEENSKKTSKKK